MFDSLLIPADSLCKSMLLGSPLWLWVAVLQGNALSFEDNLEVNQRTCRQHNIELSQNKQARHITQQDVLSAFNLIEQFDPNMSWDTLLPILRKLIHGSQRQSRQRRIGEHLRRSHLVQHLLLDCDGVLTTGQLHISEHNLERSFHIQDGLGIKHIMRAGGLVAIISGASEHPSLIKRAEMLGIPAAHIHCGVSDKAHAVRSICSEWGVPQWSCAYIGDDITDIDAFDEVAQSYVPADAHPEAKRFAMSVLRTSGGFGAVREACDRILSRAHL